MVNQRTNQPIDKQTRSARRFRKGKKNPREKRLTARAATPLGGMFSFRNAYQVFVYGFVFALISFCFFVVVYVSIFAFSFTFPLSSCFCLDFVFVYASVCSFSFSKNIYFRRLPSIFSKYCSLSPCLPLLPSNPPLTPLLPVPPHYAASPLYPIPPRCHSHVTTCLRGWVRPPVDPLVWSRCRRGGPYHGA